MSTVYLIRTVDFTGGGDYPDELIDVAVSLDAAKKVAEGHLDAGGLDKGATQELRGISWVEFPGNPWTLYSRSTRDRGMTQGIDPTELHEEV